MPLYVGIDVGKNSHVAALINADLLKKYKKYDACPIQKVENIRTGFVALLFQLNSYAELTECHVLLEHTGHYGMALEQFLQENGVQVYRMMARKRYGTNKTDTKDSRALAVMLYNQVELCTPVVDEKERIRQLVPDNDASRMLRGLVRHRYELSHESVRRKNKLIAICDELFPEFTTIYTNTNSESALALREKFPSPQLVASATLDDLCATRKRQLPARDSLIELQTLASTTIGTKDTSRCETLLLEQGLLIAELHLIHSHIGQLDKKIEAIISQSREGQILTSFTGIGANQAAAILSNIGSIANFESIAKLRSYMGWSPRESQTGTTYDSTTLNRAGNVLLKQTIYFIAMSAIQYDPRWKKLYTRLVEQKCSYDARTKRHKGKMKVVGRVAGQIIGVIWTLLRKEYDLVQSLPPGSELPPPTLYSIENKRE